MKDSFIASSGLVWNIFSGLAFVILGRRWVQTISANLRAIGGIPGLVGTGVASIIAGIGQIAEAIGLARPVERTAGTVAGGAAGDIAR